MATKTDTKTKPPVATSDDALILRNFKAARRTGVPLLGISTPDPAATMLLLSRGLPTGAEEVPVVLWDAVRGLQPRNRAATVMLGTLKNDPDVTRNPEEALKLADRFDAKSVLYMMNASMFISGDSDASKIFRQGVWNLRDGYKLTERTVVLMGPTMRLPAEIANDVIVLDEPLPTGDELDAIIVRQFANAGLDEPKPDVVSRARDAVAGLHAFGVEQVVAMSLRRDGLDFDALWKFKIEIIEQTDGLTVWRDVESFDAIGGNTQAKTFLRRLAQNGNFRVVCWIDEIEKAMAAMHSDTSGVSQDQHQVLLTVLQDNKIPAILLLGQPGSGKSAIAKALGREAGGITVKVDLGATKGGIVGESEQKIRSMFKALLGMAQGQLLLVATCNDVGALERSPELMRRFKLPKFYFDLPNADERDVIWILKGTTYDVDVTTRPNDHGWTGAEIEACCETASRLKVPVTDAAQWIVPMVQSSPEIIKSRRQAAHGRYLSSSNPGTYQMPDAVSAAPTTSSPVGRSIRLES